MMGNVNETCSKLHIIEYIFVFWLNDHFGYTTTQRDGSYKIFNTILKLQKIKSVNGFLLINYFIPSLSAFFSYASF
jgi:hypothetical protein